ncbi:hypothetical protein [Planococcus chinensis]|uniref:hypothetical protein n=1 Tax=Planococcus chinensis TaxID=272917 RepID=UPI001CC6980B|nr:hypothetical protein [Planococcus chinensis]
MSNLWVAFWAENMKVRKSKMIWVTFAAFTVAPLMAGFFMFILKNPDLAESSGLVGAKRRFWERRIGRLISVCWRKSLLSEEFWSSAL